MKPTISKCYLCGKPIETIPKTWASGHTKTYYPVHEDCGNEFEAGLKEKEKKKRIRSRMENLIPLDFRDISFDGLTVDEENRAAIEEAKKFAQNPSGMLFLHGDTGRGKTAIAIAIVQELIRAERKVRIVRSGDLIDSLKENFKRRPHERTGLSLKDYIELGVLVIDDLGAEKDTDWTVSQVYSLIDARCSNRRPTVITTNLKLKEIAEQFGTRVASRIQAAGPIIHLGGRDRRLKNGTGK